MSAMHSTQSQTHPHPFWRPVLLLFLVHVVGDFYATFCAPLLPQLRAQFGLTLEMTATLGTVYLIVQNFLQPLWGLLGERFGRYLLLALGLALAAVGMSGLGLARTFTAALIVLVLGGLGVGLFHPSAAGIAGHITRRRTTAMTVFMVGGNVGVMLAPLIVPVVAKHDLRLVALLCLPGVLLAGLLPWTLRRHTPPAQPVSWLDLAEILRAARKLFWIHLRVVLRFVPLFVVLLFLPLYCTTRGYSVIAAGRIHALVLLASSFGVLLGGWLSGKLPRRSMLVVSEVGAGVCLFCAPMFSGALFVAALSAALFLAYAVFPLQVIMAQEAVPKLKGAAASVVMGLAYGNAGLLLIPLNRMAAGLAKKYNSEMLGLSRELQVAAVGFFLAALIGLATKLGRQPSPPMAVKGAS